MRSHVKVLHVLIDDKGGAKGDGDYAIANDLVSWVTRARCVSFRGGCCDKAGTWSESGKLTWDLIKSASKYMTGVRHCFLVAIEA